MQKNLLFGISGLILGLIIGFWGSNRINREMVLQAELPPHSDAPFMNQTIQNASVKEPPATSAMLPDVTETLEKAKKEPENFDAQMTAGDMYAKIQKFDKAVEFYDSANALRPAEHEKIIRLANSFFDTGQF